MVTVMGGSKQPLDQYLGDRAGRAIRLVPGEQYANAANEPFYVVQCCEVPGSFDVFLSTDLSTEPRDGDLIDRTMAQLASGLCPESAIEK